LASPSNSAWWAQSSLKGSRKVLLCGPCSEAWCSGPFGLTVMLDLLQQHLVAAPTAQVHAIGKHSLIMLDLLGLRLRTFVHFTSRRKATSLKGLVMFDFRRIFLGLVPTSNAMEFISVEVGIFCLMIIARCHSSRGPNFLVFSFIFTMLKEKKLLLIAKWEKIVKNHQNISTEGLLSGLCIVSFINGNHSCFKKKGLWKQCPKHYNWTDKSPIRVHLTLVEKVHGASS